MVETKLKDAQVIVAMLVTDDYPDSYWEDRDYNWFTGS
jgi:hypothetical protein